MVLVPLHTPLLGEDLRHQLAQSPGLWFAFGSIAVSHFWKAFRSGYDVMPDNQLKQRVRWDVYLLMLRGITMFMMIGFAFFLVPLMALLLTYFEIWPERVSVPCSAIRRVCGNTIRRKTKEVEWLRVGRLIEKAWR